MDLNAARMLVHVVQAGSLSAAALRSAVPLPTLSRHIRALERELKVQLFERTTRGARLTQAGARLYEFALRGVEAFADGERAVTADEAQLRGRLRLSIPPAFDPWWTVLRCFQERYPDIRLSVYVSERRVDLIQEGVDVALRVNSVGDESLVARRVTSYRHVLVGSPKLIERLGEPKRAADLARYPCAAWAASIDGPSVWKLGGDEFDARPILATNDYRHLRDLALRGEVVTELPPFLAAPAIAEGLLQPLLPSSRLPEQSVNLLYLAHRYPSMIIRTYLDFCREAAAGLF
jgi:DNA-binding transcriptional LysR family regulator